MAGLKQAELVERAIDEYVEHHRELFALRMERAQEALLGGKTSTLAYSLGVDESRCRAGRRCLFRSDRRERHRRPDRRFPRFVACQQTERVVSARQQFRDFRFAGSSK